MYIEFSKVCLDHLLILILNKQSAEGEVPVEKRLFYLGKLG